MSKPDECVKVVVRVRPMSVDEERNGNLIAVEASPETGAITVRNPKANDVEPPKIFTFDAVFGPVVDQKHIYNVCAANVVDSVLNGYNGTIFAYGQTGSGKTHTMEGRPDPANLRGIIPNSFQHIFDHISSSGDRQYLVRASYLEIYNEEIRDLLSKDPKIGLELKENVDSGVYVKDLTSFVVKNITEIDHVMQAGKKNRSVGATLMNATSSRSHSIFTVVVECAETTGKGNKIRVGKLNLVDLAGSERQSKTGATGDRLKEATKINLSLTALGNVISALVDGKATYIPYRDSKLTRLLQNSLGGNAKTVMCANCGPADYNYDETLSTLRYANRAKNIKNKPKINEDPKDAMLREYQDEILKLKQQLEATQRGVVIDEFGQEIRMTNSRQEIVEVRVDMSAEQLAEVQRKADEEKQKLMKQAHEDMKRLIDQQSRTAQEREDLQRALEKEAAEKRAMEEQKKSLQNKLKIMQEKLIQGGEAMTKASQQEVQLRRAQLEVQERQQEQQRLARELVEKEEANLQLEEHFSSLQEEVEAKTKKVKKLLTKYQAVQQEVKDLQHEFQIERSDLLESVRQLTRSIKLKEVIISNFIPGDHAQNIERRAIWREEEEIWEIPKSNLTGVNLKASRSQTNQRLPRPETNFARAKRNTDSNPRYRTQNCITLDLDILDRTTQEYDNPNMVSRVDGILHMALDDDDDDDDWVEYGEEGMKLPLPYHNYPRESGDDDPISNGKLPRKGGVKKHPAGGDVPIGAARLTMPDTRKMTAQPATSMIMSNSEYFSTSRPKSASRKSRASSSSVNDRDDDRLFAGMQSTMLYDGISAANSSASRK